MEVISIVRSCLFIALCMLLGMSSLLTMEQGWYATSYLMLFINFSAKVGAWPTSVGKFSSLLYYSNSKIYFLPIIHFLWNFEFKYLFSSLKIAFVIGQWIHIHGKFLLEGNFSISRNHVFHSKSQKMRKIVIHWFYFSREWWGVISRSFSIHVNFAHDPSLIGFGVFTF